MRYPGQKESFPVYLQNMQNPATPGVGHNGTPDNPNGNVNNRPMDEPFVAPAVDGNAEVPNTGSGPARQPSILRNTNSNGRRGGESIAAMGKRVDFSLGMNAMGGIDPSGDVLDDRDTEARNRATVLRVTSPSRHSQDRNGDNASRVSNDSGRSTGIQRVGTSASFQTRERTHRNRFFSRNRHGADEEAGMADIPEVEHESRTNTLDPRTGLVSSQAVKMSTEDPHRNEDSHLLRHPTSSGALPATADSDRTFAHPSRAQTDHIEMRRMH